jgi:transketolase
LLYSGKELRLKAIELYYKAGAGHIGSTLSCIDIISSILLYNIHENDEFILSKGHAAVALYVTLNKKGLISDSELEGFYADGTKLPAHPAPRSYKGITFATGSLGHGLPIASGIAKARKINAKDGMVFVLMSDGETNEGTTWEAAHFAAKHKLDNLVVIIDKNKIQGTDLSVNVLGDTANFKKWETIGFDVSQINGHNIVEIINTVDEIRRQFNGRPKLIIANTIKGKGVSYMENTVDWHYWPMNEEQYNQAVNEIKGL